jgi:hypothetical protein
LDLDELFTSSGINIGAISPGWIGSILSFITSSDGTEEDDEEDIYFLLENGRLYIDLSSYPTDYVERYTMYSHRLTNLLITYYKRGVIPCSPTFQENFIKTWDLQKVHEQPVSSQENYNLRVNGIHLYEPMWSNEIFAPDKVSFLYDRLQGKPMLKLYVGDNYVRRHFVALALNYAKDILSQEIKAFENYVPSFAGSYVWVPVGNNVDQCKQISDVIQENQSKAEGKVQIVPIETAKDEINVRKNIESLYSNIDFGDRIVMYEQFDQPKYIVSFLLPDNVANDSLKILQRR